MVVVIPPYQVSSYRLCRKVEPGIGNKKQRWSGILKRLYRDPRVQAVEEVVGRGDQLLCPVVGNTADAKTTEARGDAPTLIAESEAKNTVPTKAEDQTGGGVAVAKVTTISGEKLKSLKRGGGDTTPSTAALRAKERRLKEREAIFDVADD